MLQKNGNNIRDGKGRRTRFNYPEVISVALKQESMGRPDFAIAVGNWTGASDRTVLNWLNGLTGPNGAYLIQLLRRSDEVLKTVLALAQRQEILSAYYDHEKLQAADRAKDDVSARPESATHSVQDVPNRDPNDPHSVPDPYSEQGMRQRWFLRQLEAQKNARAVHIAEFFGVSLKTGKRDIAVLMARGAIAYRGNRRRGCYTIVM